MANEEKIPKDVSLQIFDEQDEVDSRHIRAHGYYNDRLRKLRGRALLNAYPVGLGVKVTTVAMALSCNPPTDVSAEQQEYLKALADKEAEVTRQNILEIEQIERFMDELNICWYCHGEKKVSTDIIAGGNFSQIDCPECQGHGTKTAQRKLEEFKKRAAEIKKAKK
jgi:hypothetical protein